MIIHNEEEDHRCSIARDHQLYTVIRVLEDAWNGKEKISVTAASGVFCPVYSCETQNTRPRGGGKGTTMEMLMEINGVRMAHGKRELSMDEVAQVVGGAWDTIDFYGEEMSMADFNVMMVDFAEKLGFDVAAILFEEFTGYPCYGTHYGEYIYGDTDRDKMEMALQDFWITRHIGPY